jgi:hypothetical protein
MAAGHRIHRFYARGASPVEQRAHYFDAFALGGLHRDQPR